MNQHDKLAEPMADAFTDAADLTPYSFIPNQIPLDTLNAAATKKVPKAWQTEVAHYFPRGPNQKADIADPNLLDHAIWYVKHQIFEILPGREAHPLSQAVASGWGRRQVGFELERHAASCPRRPAGGFEPSDFDTPHRVALNYVYEVPAGRTIGDPVCWFFASQNPYCSALGQGLTDAFQLQAPGQFGNAGRNVLRGPHLSVFDFGLFKDFPVGERVNAQFRWEALNLTNTPIFGQPNGNFSVTSAGTITSLADDQRVMQFALRMSF